MQPRAWPSVDRVLLAAMLVGLVLRAWRFGTLPPGLNQDEASTAYDAFAIIHHGVDRHGNWLPVMLVSWGSGMYSLAAYLEAPFVGLFGLSVWSARLPFLLAGMAALPLFFALLRDTLDLRTARIGVVLLALCPWHIMVSRWALDSNLFPFVFLAGAWLLVRSTTRPRLLPAAAFVFGLTLYSYGTAYVVVPAFLAMVLLHGLRHRVWPWRIAAASALTFAGTATPIVLYLLVNRFGWRTIRTPFFSIPHLTGLPRYRSVGNLDVLSLDFLRRAWANLVTALHLFVSQDDGQIWNAVPGYGVLYRPSTFLAAAGLVLLLARKLRRGGGASSSDPAWPLLAWTLAALLLTVFVPANINRLNVAMFPFVYCTAVAASALWRRRAVAVLLTGLLLVSSGGFAAAYFGSYREAAVAPFFASFGEALRHAAAQTPGELCVTDEVNMPYIFALFYNREDPRLFARTVTYVNPGAEFESVRSFGRYQFGLSRCAAAASTIVATHDEAAALSSPAFTRREFERYTVLVRK